MRDDSNPTELKSDASVSRREFNALGVAAGLAVAGGTTTAQGAAAVALTETEVTITTPDGTADAAFIRPATGSYPGVIIWTDAFGLRPSMRAMARRMAQNGYAVVVPNPFYRVSKAPQFTDVTRFDFANQTDMAKLPPLMGSVNAAGNAERDAAAYLAFLDSQASVDKTKKIGAQGYCMGGALVVRTAASLPNRFGAGGSFHGGGLVTDMPNSPHLLAPRINAKLYFGVAANDDMRQPDAKDKLRQAFGNKAEVEVYASQHGWCVSDMPNMIYNQAEADRAWGKLVALYKANLV